MTDDYKALVERLCCSLDDDAHKAADAIKALTMHLGDVVAVARSARNPANYQRVGPTIDDYARALDKIADTDSRSEWIARVCYDAERYKAALHILVKAIEGKIELWQAWERGIEEMDEGTPFAEIEQGLREDFNSEAAWRGYMEQSMINAWRNVALTYLHSDEIRQALQETD